MFSLFLDTTQVDFNQKLKKFINQRNSIHHDVSSEVESIISEIKEKGDKAIIRFNNKFDLRKVKGTSELIYSEKELKRSVNFVDKKLLEAMNFAFKRIKDFHSNNLKKKDSNESSSIITSTTKPLTEITIYVPGGKAIYPSSVLMAAGPAVAAGVKNIYLTSPGSTEEINNIILAAANIAGIKKVYSLGGVQAIAAFCFGTESFPKVQKIVGPGNIYVNEAKRQLYGQVGIDMLAGPSEIVILADRTSNPDTVASDLIAQAEHDESSSAILISLDDLLIEKVKKILQEEIPKLSKEKIIKKSLMKKGAIIKIKSLEESLRIINLIAPEHLHLVNKDPDDILKFSPFAGMILVGEDTPNALSDYVLGPSHILPTGGTSRFSSPLSTDDFLVKSSLVILNKEKNPGKYQELIEHASVLARAEGLTAHDLSLKKRKE